MPHLGAVHAAAFPAVNGAGENPDAAVSVGAGLPHRNLPLHHIEYILRDDGFMVAGHIILRHLPLILHLLFREEVLGKALLQERVTLVLLILENALYRLGVPPVLAAGRPDAVSRQACRNGVGRGPLQKLGVDALNDLCLLRIHHQLTVLPAIVAQEAAEGNRNLAVCHALTLTPGAVFTDGAAFLLCQRGHDGNERFALAVEGPDVFFLEVALRAMLLQLTDRGQGVHRVVGKAADRFRYDEIDLACQCIGNHLLEAFAVLGAGAGNAFIGIHIHELPAVMVSDEVGVVVQLSLIAGLLFLMVRTDAGVSRDLPPALFRDGDRRKPCQGRLW